MDVACLALNGMRFSGPYPVQRRLPMRNVTVHQLEIFGLVIHHRGIAAAARNGYGVGKSGISEQITALEDALGGALFVRQPFQLTPLGERWAEPVRLFFGVIAGLIARSQDEPSFTFRLGASEHVLRDYMPDVLAVIARHAGDIAFKLEPLGPEEIVPRVLGGSIDVAIGPLHGEFPEGIEMLHLLSLEPVLLVPRLPEYNRIRSADFFWRQGAVRERLVRPYVTEVLTQVFQHTLRMKNVAWRPKIESGSIALVTSLVAEGGGVGLSLNLPTLTGDERVRILRLPGFPLIDYGLLWNRAAREYCAPIRVAMKASADTKFTVARSGRLLRVNDVGTGARW